jgi:hypothetical protein
MNVMLRPVMVDPWRSGGMLGGRSLFMGRPPAIQFLGASDSISQATDLAIEALSRELDAVGVEADLVSPQALRVSPDEYTQISLVGTVLAPQEIRSVIIADARALDGVATRIQTGALSHYLSQEQVSRLAAIRAGAAQLLEYEQGQDIQPISAGHMSAANQHVDAHLMEPKAQVVAAEKMVVGAEAGSVPVREPAEKTLSKTEIVVGFGVAAGLGVLLWSLLS